MENEQNHHPTHEHKSEAAKKESSDAVIYYVIGALALVAIVGAGWLLRPKSAVPTTPITNEQPGSQPTLAPTPAKPTGPITKLACELQYYNPVIGFPKYYLSVDGADVSDATRVTCDFKVSVAGAMLASESVSGQFAPAEDRGGQTFRCTTKAIEVPKNKPAKVDVVLKNDLNKEATCGATFLLP